MSLKQKISEISDSIRKSEREAGREKYSVKLIAVTKYSDSECTREFVQNGILDLAENRVDKFLTKQKDLSDLPNIRWHFIGNLQRRKVKSVINTIDVFHSLDSIKLAKEISKRAENKVRCLLEVNISGEERKHGFSPQEIEEAVLEIAQLENIEIIGLMVMAPMDASEESLAILFRDAKRLQEKIKKMDLRNVPCAELSMGMSRDYKIAIKEGATMIRIGRNFLD